MSAAAPEGTTSDARIVALEAQVLDLTRRLDETTHQLTVGLESLRHRVDGSGPRFEALYADFTDRFRGTVNEVSAKLAEYLPDVERVVSGAGGVRAVDVGPGRGEWLLLLRDAGVRAVGVDTNAAFVRAGRARGLDLVQADAVGYLRGLPAGSLDLVTAFHVIEHLDVETFLALLEAAHLALRPGGCLLLEAPNPTNLQMGACDFYNDPTHRSPLPPARTHFLVGASGFADIELRQVHPGTPPIGDDQFAATPGVGQLVKDTLYGPQDYAVLAYTPNRTA